jgi:phage baseplate assembly protein W
VSVKRGIKNILLTEEGERLMQPELGSGIRNMLFEQMTDLNAQRLETEIVSAIEAWETRAQIIAIVVTPEEEYNRYRVAITFRIINELEEQELELFLQRER